MAAVCGSNHAEKDGAGLLTKLAHLKHRIALTTTLQTPEWEGAFKEETANSARDKEADKE